MRKEWIMKTKWNASIVVFLLIGAVLSACQASPALAGPAATGNAPEQVEIAGPTPTVRLTATRQPPQAPTPTADAARLAEEAAAEAARTFFADAAENRPEAAAERISSFSLMVAQMTRGDAADALRSRRAAGERWSDLEIVEVHPFDAQTMLVRVTYSQTGGFDGDKASASEDKSTPAARGPVVVEALWPMRLENGVWRYNWENLIDFRTLDVSEQTVHGITILPVQALRYTDRIRLVLLVQNRTNESAVFGQVNETLGTFYFGDQAIAAEPTRWILNPLRSVPGAALEVEGLFANYPDRFEIRRWKNYDVEPWFTFLIQ
jgi:hypothetical protein